MNASVYHIPLPNLALAFCLVIIVVFIYARWSLDTKTLVYASVRMLLQLVLTGFALTFVFDQQNKVVICLILSAMLVIAAWIALRPVKTHKVKYYLRALGSLAIGCLLTLVVIIFGVVRLEPWYEARYLIPLAGMIFANAMNTVSLAAERFQSETERNVPFKTARATAFQTGMIPLINAFFAVGLVSLPGMMTGQILSGISPLIAVRYQAMVMCMVMGASGISTAIFLTSLKKA